MVESARIDGLSRSLTAVNIIPVLATNILEILYSRLALSSLVLIRSMKGDDLPRYLPVGSQGLAVLKALSTTPLSSM